MTNIDKRRYWQQQIDTWQHSGLTQKAYCERESVSLARFGYWRRRLANTPAKRFIALEARPVSSVVRIHLRGGVLIEATTDSLATVLSIVCQGAGNAQAG